MLLQDLILSLAKTEWVEISDRLKALEWCPNTACGE